MDNDDFALLPERARSAIDAAFETVAGTSSIARRDAVGPAPRKRRKLEPIASSSHFGGTAPAPGGFMIDEAPGGFLTEDSSLSAGGFIADAPMEGEPPSHISFDLVPGALQLLDLPPDDADVLAIFRNAAAGWGAGGGTESAGVSRKDWRAVCAVLLAGRPEGDFPVLSNSREDEDEDMDDGDDGDDYVEERDSAGSDSNESAPDGSDDAYESDAPQLGTKARRQRGSLRQTKLANAPPQLTARQKRVSRAAFALFFPDVPDDQLDNQRIRIKDISRVATLLKEKLTAEEIVEMLNEFSTAPDKSVGLSDFEQIMMLAQLV